MTNRGKKAIIFVRPAAWLCALVLLFFSLSFAACGSNSSDFDLDKCTPVETALTGKTFYWLGSSVTLGMESGEVAVADYIAARNGAAWVKEAVSGTTLIDEPYKKLFKSYDSYITRLKTTEVFDRSKKIDAFFCQISTNDAKDEFKDKRGVVTDRATTDKDKFDTKTTLGAMEYVAAYVRETWNCPVYFFSNARFDDTGLRKNKDPKGSEYAQLVKAAHEIADKWNAVGGDVRVIDLFNDEEFNNISDEDYGFYMHDPVHPYKAGYLKWWTPAFEKILFEDFGAEVQG